ncbi:peptidoglycan DD-metalloendopeptidase family protein [Simiduia sp. 21SJ11W-1]|uniref:OapA family protein n=1 Tax=Simiduia sp. 21SJ11W-1 TaxID=2909669 RepID=UPI00209E7ADD|nr:peptidoglycan DD-metalloendopeptidase family protein [Simiduia sp. 21SJ11W-1]UTA47481.1 peptidoglycan DD-metalloendopeptidase family protein [Simiduia sp. 21SJ11W-1]
MEATEKQRKNNKQPRYPMGHLLTAGALGGALLVSLMLPSEQAVATKHATVALELPLNAEPLPDDALTLTEADKAAVASVPATELAVAPEPDWQEFTVRSGDNLSLIFQRAGLNDREMYEVIANKAAADSLKRLHPGQTLGFQLAPDGKLARLKYQTNRLSHEIYERTEGGFKRDEITRTPDLITAFRHADITSSLFLAGQSAGMEPSLIMELANIFGWDVDFALDIRAGDSFSLVYQERYLDGEKLDNGAILAAEFVNQGKKFRAVRYTDLNGNSHYYTPEGDSMRKEFLRTPVDFARISSHFNLRRKHPVLHSIRAHKGTDYAASRGTPIRATGDGKVIHAGRKGGYGNAVIIQHGQTYRTLYAHMSKFARGVRHGSRVKQGQIIGYVGSTGLATGPHLHYEFYVNGAVRNPVTVPLPKANAVAKAEKARFFAQTATALATLEDYQRSSQLAQVNQ